jgi:hypothetical protein
MERIGQKHSKLLKTKFVKGRRQWFARSNRKEFEWDILGTACSLLADAGLDCPVFADESEAPDFIGYCEDKRFWSKIEVTEVIEPGYKRNEAMRQDFVEGVIFQLPPPLKRPFQGLREAIVKKAKKPYAPDCVLIVYFDIPMSAVSYDTTGITATLAAEAEREPFGEIGALQRVLLLTSGLNELIVITKEGIHVLAARPLDFAF